MVLVQVSPGCYRERVPTKGDPAYSELGREFVTDDVDRLVRDGTAVKVLTDIGGGNMRNITWAEHKRQPTRPQSAAPVFEREATMRSRPAVVETSYAPSASYRPPAPAQPAAPRTKTVRTLPDEAHSMGRKETNRGIPDSAYRC